MEVPVVKRLSCTHCGSENGSRYFLFVESCGSLFIDYFASDDGSDHWKVLCAACWPKWLAWKARLGFDLHTHGIDRPCRSTCLARTSGRHLQFAVMRSVWETPSTVFWLAKTLDGMPGVNGSTSLAGRRMAYFLSPGTHRQTLYESIGTISELQRQMLWGGRLDKMALPRYSVDAYSLVFEVFSSAHNSVDGQIRHPAPGERSLGLHSVTLTGYEDGGNTLCFVNSWGPSWGNQGYGTVTLEYLNRFFYEGWVAHPGRWGLSRAKMTSMAARDTDAAAFRQLWLIENPRVRRRLRDLGNGHWRTGWYEGISPQEDCSVECLEVRNGFGLRMGWIFVYHLPDRHEGAAVSEIRELFVMPAFRRMGIGRYLQTWAGERAAEAGSSQLWLVLNEADATLGPGRATARAFGARCGYQWRWRERIGPRAVATGVKALAGA